MKHIEFKRESELNWYGSSTPFKHNNDKHIKCSDLYIIIIKCSDSQKASQVSRTCR